MAKQNYVTVELIKNPAVKRQMTPLSAKFNAGRWRIVEDESVKVAEEPVKKKDAEPVEGTEAEFAPVSHETSEIESLRAEYEQLTGKKPHGRTKAETLKQEIETIKAQKNEA